MKKIIAVILLVCSVSYAGDRYLGTITVTDAGSVCNTTTILTPAFDIRSREYISVQALDGGMWVRVEQSSVAIGNGVKVLADGFLDTTIEAELSTTYWDAGTYVGGVVCCKPDSTAAGQCIVNYRSGKE